jgi:hypothetical protein
VPEGLERPAHDDTGTALVKVREIRRCLLSHLGTLEAICEEMPPGPNGFILRATIEGGMPEILDLADDAVHALSGPSRDCDLTLDKSFARGFQVAVLMRREEETGQRDAAAWKQDPDEFMESYVAAMGGS